MSYAEIVRSGDDWFRAELGGLENPANRYDKFDIEITNSRGVEVLYDTWTASSAASYTFYEARDLPGTGTVHVYFRAMWNGRWYSVGSFTFNIVGGASYPGVLRGLRSTGSTGNSVSLSWYSSSDTDWYEIYVDNRYYTDTTRTSYTVSGLAEDTRYQFKVVPCNSSVCGGSDYIYATTKSNKPGALSGLKVVNYTSSTLTVSWNRATNATGYRVSLNGSTHGTTSNTTYTFYGLKPDTFYSVMVIPYNSSGNGDGESIGITTDSARPENFQWSYSKTPGGPVYRTVVINGKPRAQILVAWEWNNFTDRINEFRVFKGLSKYNFTRAVTNEPFKKSYLEEARSAIRSMNSGVPSISSGNIVRANDFNDLRDALNEIR